jgi:hypothetical protein
MTFCEVPKTDVINYSHQTLHLTIEGCLHQFYNFWSETCIGRTFENVGKIAKPICDVSQVTAVSQLILRMRCEGQTAERMKITVFWETTL